MLTRASVIKDKLIDRFGFDKLPPEEFSSLMEKIEEGLSFRVGAAIIEALPEDQRDIFVDLIDRISEEEAVAWLKEKISNFDSFMDKLVEEHCEEIANLIQS